MIIYIAVKFFISSSTMYYYSMRQLRIEEKITNRSRAVERYFNELSIKKRITLEEEVELAMRIRKGDKAALDKLVEANLRFVVSVAKQYSRDPDTLLELVGQGNLGLIEAAQKFDETRGFKFISYAIWFIRKEILLYFGTNKRTIKMPIKAEQDLRRIRKAEAELEMKLERPPSTEEIAEELSRTGEKIKVEKIETLIAEERVTVPLESQTDEEWAPIQWLLTEDEGLVQFENSVETPIRRRLFEEMMGVLSPIEKTLVTRVLALDGGTPAGYAAVGEGLGMKEGWARNAYLMAIKKMLKRYKKITNTSEKIPYLF